MRTKKNLVLCEELIKVFGEELRYVFRLEAEDDKFLNQDNYDSCLERAEQAFKLASERPVNILALSIADHRADAHGDGTEIEAGDLKEVMSDEDKETAGKGGWLNKE